MNSVSTFLLTSNYKVSGMHTLGKTTNFFLQECFNHQLSPRFFPQGEGMP